MLDGTFKFGAIIKFKIREFILITRNQLQVSPPIFYLEMNLSSQDNLLYYGYVDYSLKLSYIRINHPQEGQQQRIVGHELPPPNCPNYCHSRSPGV